MNRRTDYVKMEELYRYFLRLRPEKSEQEVIVITSSNRKDFDHEPEGKD